ncbi:uncharacterized protein LOC108674942 [Hyalella azteca]|uniref:Uncharacterized protein LOC108674942 n=1 Tax=Hyalella azteca TaxID=294128 RepID=A0A8B7P004_HYAAZ|nr:uncharacterized protein LOC108674942 [Hyalella azteca]
MASVNYVTMFALMASCSWAQVGAASFRRVQETCGNKISRESAASLMGCAVKCGMAPDCLGMCYSASSASCVLHKSSDLVNSSLISGMRSYAVYADRKTHEQAFNSCRALDSYLVAPQSKDEMLTLISIMDNSVGIWMAIDAIGRNGTSIVTSGGPADGGGQAVQYYEYALGQPDHLATLEQCMQLWPSGFNDAYCMYELPYICQSSRLYSCVTLPHPAYPADYACFKKLK